MSEIFGLDVVFYLVESDEEVVRIANAIDFGLAMSVFSGDKKRYEDLVWQLEAGILNWNCSMVGVFSKFFFGGIKCLGNYCLVAFWVGFYCTYF